MPSGKALKNIERCQFKLEFNLAIDKGHSQHADKEETELSLQGDM